MGPSSVKLRTKLRSNYAPFLPEIQEFPAGKRVSRIENKVFQPENQASQPENRVFCAENNIFHMENLVFRPEKPGFFRGSLMVQSEGISEQTEIEVTATAIEYFMFLSNRALISCPLSIFFQKSLRF